MAMVIWGIFLIIIIAFKYGRHLYYNNADKKRTIDDKILEENVKIADLYEIAYLKGREKEVFQLAFYTLIKSGYLLPLRQEDASVYPPKKYYLDESKDLSVLHEVERVAAKSYAAFRLLPEQPRNTESIKNIISNYNQKANTLFLVYPDRIVEYEGSLTIFILVVVPVIYFLNRNNATAAIMTLMSLLAYLLIKNFSINSFPQITRNGKQYIALFEKMHFPYPDFRKDVDKNYLEMITPCSL